MAMAYNEKSSPLNPVDYNLLGLHALEFDRHLGERSESLLEEHLKEGRVDLRHHLVPADRLAIYREHSTSLPYKDPT